MVELPPSLKEDDLATKQKENARLIPDEPRDQLKLASLSVRPLRLAFLLNSQASKQDLLQLITYNTAIWGGASNLFVPVRNFTISEDWWDTLRLYDPDKLIFFKSYNQQLMAKTVDRLQPFFQIVWSDDDDVKDKSKDEIEEFHRQGTDGIGSVPLAYVLQYIYEQIKPIQESNIRIPKCQEGSLYNFCTAAQFGKIGKFLLDNYTHPSWKGEFVELKNEDLKSYLQVITEFRRRLSPLDNPTKIGCSFWRRAGRVAR